MENSGEFQFVSCKCGKILRLKISKKKYGKKVVAICQNCKAEHHITILSAEIPDNTADQDFEEVKPYVEILAGKLEQGIQNLGQREDILSLRKFFFEKGFAIDLAISIAILKHTNKPACEMSETDADFLKKMNIKYD